jgi:hypothetical protein
MADIRIVKLDDLREWWESGDSIRACCPVHGGDNPTALQVDVDGEYAGFGYCHRCGRTVVLVEDLNPAAAERIRRSGRVGQRTDDVVVPSPLRQANDLQTKARKEAQEKEHSLLCSLDVRMQRALEWSSWAQQYLFERRVSPDIALSEGIGYFSRAILDDPAYVHYERILRLWRNTIVFPLCKRVTSSPDAEAYTQGCIGRTLAFWRPGIGMDEDEQKRLIDAHNDEVREYNKHAKESGDQKFRKLVRRWSKTEPAGWIYLPMQIGTFAALVEGGFDKLALLTALSMMQGQRIAASFEPGCLIGLAGTAARAELLPPHIQTLLLSLDGDEAGLERMLCLREEQISAGRWVYLCPPPVDDMGKDWSARWRNGGHQGVQPFFTACDYVASWITHPDILPSCILLVEELSDALAFLEAGSLLGLNIGYGDVIVATAGSFNSEWFGRRRVQSVVFAPRLFLPPDHDDQRRVDKVRKTTLSRLLVLRRDLLRSGVRVYDCPLSGDGEGVLWSDRWRIAGIEGIRQLCDAYSYAKSEALPLSA